MIGIPSATAAFFFLAQSNSSGEGWNPTSKRTDELVFRNTCGTNTLQTSRRSATGVIATSLGNNEDETRSFRTPADEFFKEHKKIPLPSLVHTTLEMLSATAATGQEGSKTDEKHYGSMDQEKKKILVIGDVHGCYDELLELHTKAVAENDGTEFQSVILVGDLCNKGPESARVIRHVRSSPGWFSVRGNHDDSALAAALGDTNRLKKKTYAWVTNSRWSGGGDSNDGDEGSETSRIECAALSDDDVNWLSELPYTIRIPGHDFGEDEDTLIVHAGLVPNFELRDQKIQTMTTVRDLLSRCNENEEFTHFEYHNSKNGESPKVIDAGASSEDNRVGCNEAVTWASAWEGPERVVFGHDARRKLQLHKGNWATGLDTGAVYGGELTGIILPERTLVSVKSKEYSPIVGKVK